MTNAMLINSMEWPVAFTCPYCPPARREVHVNLDGCLRSHKPVYPVAVDDPILNELLTALSFSPDRRPVHPCRHLIAADVAAFVAGPESDGEHWEKWIDPSSHVIWFGPILKERMQFSKIHPPQILAPLAKSIHNPDGGEIDTFEFVAKYVDWRSDVGTYGFEMAAFLELNVLLALQPHNTCDRLIEVMESKLPRRGKARSAARSH